MKEAIESIFAVIAAVLPSIWAASVLYLLWRILRARNDSDKQPGDGPVDHGPTAYTRPRQMTEPLVGYVSGAHVYTTSPQLRVYEVLNGDKPTGQMVRPGTQGYIDAFNTPGVYLKGTDGEMIAGVQE